MSRYQLTARETDVMALIGAGLNNTEIAARLYLSMSTVKTHVTNVLAETGSRDRVRAALLAIRAGLTSRPPPAWRRRVENSWSKILGQPGVQPPGRLCCLTWRRPAGGTA